MFLKVGSSCLSTPAFAQHKHTGTNGLSAVKKYGSNSSAFAKLCVVATTCHMDQ